MSKKDKTKIKIIFAISLIAFIISIIVGLVKREEWQGSLEQSVLSAFVFCPIGIVSYIYRKSIPVTKKTDRMILGGVILYIGLCFIAEMIEITVTVIKLLM